MGAARQVPLTWTRSGPAGASSTAPAPCFCSHARASFGASDEPMVLEPVMRSRCPVNGLLSALLPPALLLPGAAPIDGPPPPGDDELPSAKATRRSSPSL